MPVRNDYGCLCVFVLFVCVLVTTFVSLYGGAKWGCLCHRSSVSAVCVSVCVYVTLCGCL